MKKAELSSQNSENIGDGSQQPIMPSDIDIWIDSVGEKKGRIFGFGSLSKSLMASSNKTTRLFTTSEDVDAIRS
ncbi:hypothetical protein SESBI_43815 [Sesbania bispinosa]|nr:hypothetical protein SESBI_43815 [Sesbania bispinosa]